MAVNLTVEQLSNALRLGSSTEETAEATRLLAYATEAVVKHAPAASDTAHTEAAIRLCGYLYDQPSAGRGQSFAHAGRNSGAWAILLAYRIHRAGSTREAIQEAQAAVGSINNPVIDVTITGDALVITFADGSTESHELPAGGGGVDQVARDEAQAAQSDIDQHEATPHNHDTTARTEAGNAQTTADSALSAAEATQQEIDDHEANHPSGGGGGESTPPVVLVDAEAYTEHGDVTIEGWRDYDFIQFFCTHGTNTYQSEPVNTAQLVLLSPVLVPMGRNVAWTLTISATDDDLISLAASSGTGVPSPNANSTITVIGWFAGTAVEGGGGAGLPNGSDALDELRWRGEAWTPISPNDTQYAAWTRDATYATLETLFNAVAAEPGGLGATADAVLFNLDRTATISNRLDLATVITLDAIWPVGGTAPYIWLVSPKFYGWLPNYQARSFTRKAAGSVGEAQLELADFVIQDYPLSIDGVPYDVGVVQCPLDRPEQTDQLVAQMQYTAPVQTTRDISQTEVVTPGGGGGGNGNGNGNGNGGGPAAKWYWASFVNGPFTDGTAKASNFQTFPIGPYADYAALQAAVISGEVAQLAVRVSENDHGDADQDHQTAIFPNILGFYESAGLFKLFPGHALSVDPVSFEVTFGATELTIETDADIASSPLVQVRIGIWV